MSTLFVSILAAVSIMAGINNVKGTLVEALDDSVWEQSQWISAADAPVITGYVEGNNERAADGASWFVTSIATDKKIAAARWMTTGLGTYDLYVNGQLIGAEVLKPGFTHFQKTRRSFTYDITDALNTAPGAHNVLAAEATPGWWADKIITVSWHQGMNGSKPAFRGVLELTFADGSRKYYGTNTTEWLAGVAGPVTHAAIFDGEEYDARIAPGYETLDKLSTPEINSEFTGEILPTAGAEVYLRTDLALMPVKAYLWNSVSGKTDDAHGTVVINKEFEPGSEMTVSPGETLVVDFGQNAAAVPAFVFVGAEGTTLHVRPGELLNDGNGAFSRGMDGPEGSVHRLNLRIPDTGALIDYTFGSSHAAYIPRHSFFGYRYLSISTEGAPVTIKELVSIPVSSITAQSETGKIVTGNEMVNKLISNTLWGQRSNYLSVSTDCPQRNERLGWTADTQVFARTGSFFANTGAFFHKWMRDMRDMQNEFGAFPSVAPYGQYGSDPTDMMRLGWSDAGVIVPWTVWLQFGDIDIINENWQAMEKYTDHIAEHKYAHSAYAAENNNFQYGDWLSYEPLESCGGSIWAADGVYHPETIEYWDFLGASYWAIDAQMMADMALATGRNPEKYTAMADEARKYLKEHFLNPDGSFKTPIFNTMQTPRLFALKNNLLQGQAQRDMAESLRKNFAEHGNCLQTGFLGTSILMPTLTDNGMADIAYELLFQRRNPSWLYSIDNGATTIWERWNSYMIEHGMGPRGMNSFNHYAYGCVCQWLWETAAGIAADKYAPGFKHIIMAPVPDKRLGYLEAEYPSAAGIIKSSWRYDTDGTWTWNFTIPEGATASVTAPGDSTPTEYSSGAYTITRKL